MSRTLRRRHDRWAVLHEIHWYLGCWSGSDPIQRWRWGLFIRNLRVNGTATDDEVTRVVTAHFHRDRDVGDRNAPASFRRMLNAQHRSRQKAALQRAIAEDADDVQAVVKRSANWEWF